MTINQAIRQQVLVGAAIAIGALLGANNAWAADMSGQGLLGGQPVYRCEVDGFIEIPSSDICLAIGGYARFVTSVVSKNWSGDDSYTVNHISVDGYTVLPHGIVPRIVHGYRRETLQTYAEARLTFDARTVTEFGTVRAYVEAEADGDNRRTGGPLELRHAFVQFGNWTFGKTWSTFLDIKAAPNYSDAYQVVGDNTDALRRSQIRYTQPLGHGLSLLLALEDQEYNDPPAAIIGVGPNLPIVNPAATAVSIENISNYFPDAVVALDWQREGVGLIRIAGALHQNSFGEVQTIGGVPVLSYSDDQLGFALTLGMALDLPTGDGDKFTFIANYADGASQYLQDIYASSTEVAWGRCGAVNCILDQVKIWTVLASMNHNWTPTIATTIGAGYARTNYGAVGTALIGSGPGPGVLDVSSFEGFANIQWTPVPKTSFMLDVHYGHINYNGFDLNPAVAGIQDSQGAWAGTFEVTRHF